MNQAENPKAGRARPWSREGPGDLEGALFAHCGSAVIRKSQRASGYVDRVEAQHTQAERVAAAFLGQDAPQPGFCFQVTG